ncbi:hypothetical protein RclHR1_02340013 [Rhizophagus clarus]|uniref:Uncharacterized protein n=1 Tax=Rhizophagus clarus TaxID=94130 RepID=A0A2Z6RQ86_9GLOM|nr:hypothetical protein RclHR1_02340013 [Rhizophagus clarus]
MHIPTNFDQTDRRTLTHYDGTNLLVGIPSHNDIVTEFDNGVTVILQQSLSGKQPIHFMLTEVSDDIERYSSYILRIISFLINGQKAVTILARILSVTFKNTTKFGFEDICAFLLQGYHIEKKAYIRVKTWNHFDRYNALKAICEVRIHTASDNLNCQYYYDKVACEERLPLSSWAILSNYLYKFTSDST